MSSHWEWEKRIAKEHDENKPFAPENGEPLKFKAGDTVIFTNDYGIEFKLKVKGIYKPEATDALYALGYRYFLESSSPWMPVPEFKLRLAEQ